MVDLGDLREGLWPNEVLPFVREALRLPGIRIAGLGTNLACFGGVVPNEANMRQLVELAEAVEQTFGFRLEWISGANSSGLHLIAAGRMPPKVDPQTRPTMSLGPLMIGIATAQELRENLGDVVVDGRSCTAWIDFAIDQIARHFVKPDLAAVLETVGPAGEVLDYFDGRQLNPGHAIECAWFVSVSRFWKWTSSVSPTRPRRSGPWIPWSPASLGIGLAKSFVNCR